MHPGQYISRSRLSEIVTVVYQGNQRAAARHFQVTEPTLSRILSGEIGNPRIAQVTRIALSLGITVDSLLQNGQEAAPS